MGMAFVGAMRAFEAAGHTIGRLVGSSAGAITATSLAAGYSAAEMLAALDEKAGGSFLKASPDQREQALKAIEGTEFFGAVRTKTVVGLYNQVEVWEKFGYEGSSFEHGGYIFRGFNDLSWLPDPPPEASPRVQI